MSKNIDLTGKILINDHFQITIGRFLFVLIIVFIQCASLFFVFGGFHPSMLVLITNMMFSLEKRYDKTPKEKLN